MSIHTSHFGTLENGTQVDQFTLTNDAGLLVKYITYGARITEIHMPDRRGTPAPVVLGFNNLQSYLEDKTYFGPVCGRYANRLAYGRFVLDGVEYHLPINDPDGPNTLHGGPQGFDKKIWRAELHESSGICSVRFSYLSPHLEEGFPGDLIVNVTYTLTQSNELRIDYAATCDRPTIINLTNHIYFNLAGAGNGDVLEHIVTIDAHRYASASEQYILTGELVDVRGTPLDFTSPRTVGEHISDLKNGYDHTYALGKGILSHAARLTHEPSGRNFQLFTDQPAMQFYTAGKLDGSKSGIGGVYRRFGACVFEPMHFPDSPHHPNFPSTVLRPGQTFRRKTIYRFSIV